MDDHTNYTNKKYDRVMSRVYNRSRNSLKSTSFVTRHETPSARLGGKPSVSNVSSAVFSDLPIVLNDFKLDSFHEKPVKRTFVVKPRRTLKSLDPALSPPRSVRRSQELRPQPRAARTRSSAPSVLAHGDDKWPESHMRQCYSSRSHSKLKELKDEIKAYEETDKMLRLRCKLYKSCGVVLDETGQVAADKAVQVELVDTEKVVKMKWKNMRAYFFKILKTFEKASNGDSQIFNCSWPLYPQLMFLKDVVDKDPNGSLTAEEYELLEKIGKQDAVNNTPNNNEISAYQQPPLSLESAQHKEPPSKRLRPASSTKQCNKEEEFDSDLHFLQSLLPFMREFPLKHKLRVRSEIQDLILTELESLDEALTPSVARVSKRSSASSRAANDVDTSAILVKQEVVEN